MNPKDYKSREKKLIKTEEITITDLFMVDSYELKIYMHASPGPTGLQTLFELIPKSPLQQPGFHARWDSKTDTMDIDVFMYENGLRGTSPLNDLWKQSYNGDSGHHPPMVNPSQFEVTISTAEAKVIFQALIDVTGLQTSVDLKDRGKLENEVPSVSARSCSNCGKDLVTENGNTYYCPVCDCKN